MCLYCEWYCLFGLKNVKNQTMSVQMDTHSCRSENKIMPDLVTALFVRDKWAKSN